MKSELKSFKKSISRFEEIIKKKKTVANRDSAIKRFEFTFELGWKALKSFLLDQGVPCRSPKECLKEAFKLGIIRDNAGWLEMLQDRNLTVHTYDEKTADKVYKRLPKHLRLFKNLLENIKAV